MWDETKRPYWRWCSNINSGLNEGFHRMLCGEINPEGQTACVFYKGVATRGALGD